MTDFSNISVPTVFAIIFILIYKRPGPRGTVIGVLGMGLFFISAVAAAADSLDISSCLFWIGVGAFFVFLFAVFLGEFWEVRGKYVKHTPPQFGAGPDLSPFRSLKNGSRGFAPD